MPAHKAITSGMSLLSAARDVVTVPAKSARGTAYCSTIRFRVGASFEPKSCRRAATKPSRNVTTIGRSALKIMSSTAIHSPLAPRGQKISVKSATRFPTCPAHVRTRLLFPTDSKVGFAVCPVQYNEFIITMRRAQRMRHGEGSMELQQLKYFREVAKLEHVTRAAEKLFVSQSAISRAVTQLEEELGVPLFYRQGRAVVLSRYGCLFLEHVNRALSVLESGKRLLSEQTGEESGTVSLGFLHSLGVEMVPRLIKEYRRTHPMLQFILLVQRSGEKLME